MKILIACEKSQAVTIEMRKRGHEAFSCDIQPCSGGYPEFHLKCDVRDIINNNWDFVGGHPPCDRLANSGIRWLYERDLWDELKEGCDLFNLIKNRIIEVGKGYIENPIPHKHAVAHIGKYDQIVHPYHFGDGVSKSTCLWLFGVPKLVPTRIVAERRQAIWKMPGGKHQKEKRSNTFPGIAKAIALQWT